VQRFKFQFELTPMHDLEKRVKVKYIVVPIERPWQKLHIYWL